MSPWRDKPSLFDFLQVHDSLVYAESPSDDGVRSFAVIENIQKKSQHSCWPSDGDIHSLVVGASSRKAFRQELAGRHGPGFPLSCGD
jgi:hypothetical protein